MTVSKHVNVCKINILLQLRPTLFFKNHMQVYEKDFLMFYPLIVYASQARESVSQVHPYFYGYSLQTNVVHSVKHLGRREC